MQSLQERISQAIPRMKERELQSVANSVWEADGTVCLAISKSSAAESAKPRNPRQRPWPAAILLLALGCIGIAVSVSGRTPVTNSTGNLLYTLPVNPLFAGTGLLCVIAAYFMLCGISLLMIDPRSRQWTLKRGVLPFTRTQTGALDRADTRWEMVAVTRGAGTKRERVVWTLRLVGVPTGAPTFTEMSAFDLIVAVVEHDVALQTFRGIAERTGMALTDGTTTAEAVALVRDDRYTRTLTALETYNKR